MTENGIGRSRAAGLPRSGEDAGPYFEGFPPPLSVLPPADFGGVLLPVDSGSGAAFASLFDFGVVAFGFGDGRVFEPASAFEPGACVLGAARERELAFGPALRTPRVFARVSLRFEPAFT